MESKTTEIRTLTTDEMDSSLWTAVRRFFNVTAIKAVPYVDKPSVFIPVNELGRWVVPSSRNPKETYLVVRKNHDVFVCDCKGFVYNHKCKHVNEKRKLFGLI